VGRRDAAKQVPDLIRHFCAYIEDQKRRDLRLVLVGPGAVEIPSGIGDRIVDLGFLEEQDKQDAYAAADVFCLPSRLESFSLVLMEAWLQGAPALVNAEGAVAVHHCRRSNGGLYYHGYEEFAACLDYLLGRPALRRRMGAAGRAYVLREHTWPVTLERVVRAAAAAGLPLETMAQSGIPGGPVDDRVRGNGPRHPGCRTDHGRDP